MARGKLFVGTSGFAYKSWKPDFYPADLKDREMLRFYAERLPSVEINNTFYRMPSAKLLQGWSEETPETFALTLKAPQRITHIRRLKGGDDGLEYFLSTAATLGPRLGCLLFQCPPNLRYAADLLEGFLARLPGGGGPRVALEFRHPSWHVPEVADRLCRARVAWCAADTDDADASLVRTAEAFVYVRLRKVEYSPDALERWAEALARVLDEGADAYVYFKHEEDPAGARHALWLRERLGG